MTEFKPVGEPSPESAYLFRHLLATSEEIGAFVTHPAMQGAKNDASYLKAMASREQSSLALGRYRFTKERPNRTSRVASNQFARFGKETYRGLQKKADHRKK